MSLLLLLLGIAGAVAGVPFQRGDPPEELAARLARIQDGMRLHRLDAIILTTEANVRYTTGYHSAFWLSPTRPWFVVVPVEGGPIAVVPTIGEDAFARTNCVKVVTWPAPRPEDDGVSELSAVLLELPLNTGRIGAELGPETVVRMPLQDFNEVRRRLESEGREVVDASPVILGTRLRKSPFEIAKVEATCQAMSAAYSEVPSVISEGMTEFEVCNAVKRLFLSKGLDDTNYVICRSGPRSYSDIIGQPTGRRLRAGDMLILDSGSQTDGYYCDFNRNYAIGQPSTEAVEAHEKVYTATDAGLSVIKPGAKFQDIYIAMVDAMNVSAEGGVGRMGHSVGLQLTEWPSIHPSTTHILEEGMILAVEPSFALPGGHGAFVVTEEEVLVTATGYRLLTERAPRSLPIVTSRGSQEL